MTHAYDEDGTEIKTLPPGTRLGIALLGGTAVLIAITFAVLYAKVGGKPAHATQRPQEQPKVPVLRASELFGEYEDNEVAADQRHKGKVIEVLGVVNRIGKDLIDTPYVSLDIGKQFSVFSVQCMFKKAHEDALADLSPGKAVAIRGRCAGKMGNVLLRDCEIKATR